jgi:hypothetical protein
LLSNYAFETNFSSEDPMKTAREFKKAGYEIHLIFSKGQLHLKIDSYPAWVIPIIEKYRASLLD